VPRRFVVRAPVCWLQRLVTTWRLKSLQRSWVAWSLPCRQVRVRSMRPVLAVLGNDSPPWRGDVARAGSAAALVDVQVSSVGVTGAICAVARCLHVNGSPWASVVESLAVMCRGFVRYVAALLLAVAACISRPMCTALSALQCDVGVRRCS
jgi:hypothetical protein